MAGPLLASFSHTSMQMMRHQQQPAATVPCRRARIILPSTWDSANLGRWPWHSAAGSQVLPLLAPGRRPPSSCSC